MWKKCLFFTLLKMSFHIKSSPESTFAYFALENLRSIMKRLYVVFQPRNFRKTCTTKVTFERFDFQMNLIEVSVPITFHTKFSITFTALEIFLMYVFHVDIFVFLLSKNLVTLVTSKIFNFVLVNN